MEIIVVVVIITLLAAIIYANLRPATAKARDAARMSDIDQLAVSLRLYVEQHDSFPSFDGGTQIGQGGSFDGAIAPYMNVPNDPLGSGNADHYYVYNSREECDDGFKVVVYGTLEQQGKGNWREVCDSNGPENRYGRVF